MTHDSDCKCSSCEEKRMTASAKASAAAQFLSFLGYTEEDLKKSADMIGDAVLTAKAMPRSEDDSMPTIEDRWHKGRMHTVPTGEQIKVGPGQSASGGGAEHMVGHYSADTPQKGITLEAEHLAGELGAMRGYAKSIATAHDGLCKAFDEFGNVLAKMDDTQRRLTLVCAGLVKKAEEHDDDEEKEEKFEINASKAQESYAKARELLKKSRRIRAEMKAAADAGHIGALKSQAKLFKKAAQAYFSKAAQYAKAGGPRAVVSRKAIDEFFAANPSLKADIDPAVSAKSLAEAAKKARTEWKAAVKAAAEVVKKDDDKGNQDDKENKENHNQDDSAAKAADAGLKSQVESALAGIGMLETTVKGLMEALAGRPVTPKVEPLSIVKSGGNEDPIRKIDERIEKFVTDRRLDQASETRARSLLSYKTAVIAGKMTEEAFAQQLGAAPPSVQEVFRVA